MNKTWITLIVMAMVTILLIVGYQFYISFSGQNVDFTKTLGSEKVSPNLGVTELEFLDTLEENVVVDDNELTK